MENFFYNDEFYSDIESLINDIFEDESEVAELQEDTVFNCTGTKEEPIFVLSSEWITDRIDDDRLSESNSENEVEDVTKALESHIDYDKINELIPKLYFIDDTSKFVITKQDLLNSIK